MDSKDGTVVYNNIVAQHAEVEGVVGVLPNVISAEDKVFPAACWKPAWNSLRKPGWSVPETPGVQASSGAKTGLEHPELDRTRFSLNGVSKVRA